VLTVETLKKHLKYDPSTGKWTRLLQCGSHKPGSKVGCVNLDREGRPYNRTQLYGVFYKMSRLAVFYMTGKWPVGVVDHKDGNTINDAWKNLRDCTQQQNSCNRRTNANNKSGHKGVRWNKRREHWFAIIIVDRKTHYLGRFDDVDAAALAYQAAAKKHHGEFARA